MNSAIEENRTRHCKEKCVTIMDGVSRRQKKWIRFAVEGEGSGFMRVLRAN